MQVREQNDDCEHDGKSEENITQGFVMPKDERQEERNTRVSRKEKIIADENSFPKTICKNKRTDFYPVYKRPDVREADENRSDYRKDRYTFHHEGQIIWPAHAHEERHKKKDHRAPNKSAVQVIRFGVGKDDISHMAARYVCGVDA